MGAYSESDRLADSNHVFGADAAIIPIEPVPDMRLLNPAVLITGTREGCLTICDPDSQFQCFFRVHWSPPIATLQPELLRFNNHYCFTVNNDCCNFAK